MSFDYLKMKDQDCMVFGNLTADEANDWVEKRNEALYRKEPDRFTCKHCNATIMQTTLYVSIHDKHFSGCAGSGEVRRANLAYCPNCEGEPKIARACIHEQRTKQCS